MKIKICGSMAFSREMIEAKKRLDSMGHAAEIPCDAVTVAEGLYDNTDMEADFEHCVKNDVIRKDLKSLSECDAILVLNYPKNGINGYIGASTLMEIGLAYHLGLKIFLLNKPPPVEKARYSHELRIINPVVLYGS
ncbi:MAG: hypothetical protein HY518_03210, partial [Candidatus Aenigmarchaeota archaeon]|nr:hypothetical protein [Candidatus Aenigmarchaeota archaeon]